MSVLLDTLRLHGEKKGQGVYGLVLKVLVTKENLAILKLIYKTGTERILERWPSIGTYVACKIQTSERVAQHEARIMQELQKHSLDFIPRLYMSCSVNSLNHLIVMEYIDFEYNLDYLLSHNIRRPTLRQQISDLLVRLWFAGYAHTDAHSGNFIYSPKRDKTYLIDFGFMIRLPPFVVTRAKEQYSLGQDALDTWYTAIHPFVDMMNKVLKHRNTDNMNMYYSSKSGTIPLPSGKHLGTWMNGTILKYINYDKHQSTNDFGAAIRQCTKFLDELGPYRTSFENIMPLDHKYTQYIHRMQLYTHDVTARTLSCTRFANGTQHTLRLLMMHDTVQLDLVSGIRGSLVSTWVLKRIPTKWILLSQPPRQRYVMVRIFHRFLLYMVHYVDPA